MLSESDPAKSRIDRGIFSRERERNQKLHPDLETCLGHFCERHRIPPIPISLRRYRQTITLRHPWILVD
jgi:hypothetical protein